MARPFKELDKDNFERLCSMLCTQEEICSFLDTTDKTLDKWCVRTYGERYSEIYKKLSQVGKISLRRNLMKLSERNASVAIFLAKNLLGYSDDGMRKADEQTASILSSIKEVLDEDVEEAEVIKDGLEHKAEADD